MNLQNPRAKQLNQHNLDDNGECVLYVMSRDQRVTDNHALLIAQEVALQRELPLLILFNAYPQVTHRHYFHYWFMFENLKQVESELQTKNIPMLVTVGNAIENVQTTIQQHNPAVVFFDFSPLRGPQKVMNAVVDTLNIPVIVVDTHNIVPVWEASAKQEYAARTIRPKIRQQLAYYMTEPDSLNKHPHILNLTAGNDWDTILQNLTLEKIPGHEPPWKPGEKEAMKTLKSFLQGDFKYYSKEHNEPSQDAQSQMSPYLHYGQISSLRIALETNKYVERHSDNKALLESKEAFLEELIIRKELADNFCYYNNTYDSLEGAPRWARETLTKHRDDPRNPLYTIDQLENCKTHDEAWNAAQTQAKRTGKMHGYMRMYWAKKILEWTESPEQAIEFCIYLNDKYHLDGHDPNGYTNILWAIGGLHDHGWQEREIFGTIRYMNYNGLQRKFDIEAYIQQWLNT